MAVWHKCRPFIAEGQTTHDNEAARIHVVPRYTLLCVSPAIEPVRRRYRSIFTPATRRERIANFEAYWAYSVSHDGEILQGQKDLTKKRETLTGFQAHPEIGRASCRERV